MKNILKARTIFAFMFYSVFLYLVVMEKNLPQELVLIVGSILGFYYGSKKQKEVQNGPKTGNIG